jgi:hypothetical protein
VPYSTTLAATGGTPPYSWAVTAGVLPAGLGLTGGVIAGTATTAGTSPLTLQVVDALGASATRSLTLAVAAAAPPPTPALVQSQAVRGTATGSVSIALPAVTAAGNLLVAVVRMSTTSQTVSLADSAGNTYRRAVSQAQSGDGSQVHIFYAAPIAGGPVSVTATFSASNNHPWLAVLEYSGVGTLDGTGSAQGSTAAPSCTATAAVAGELVIGALGLPSSSTLTVTAGPGLTLELQDPQSGGSRAAAADGTAAAGGVTGSFALSGSAAWSCAVATFR